ncbi:hypothetical protein Dxin01_00371 [Deinococcus xinjiangensis]|uniref:Uncharacterized protein n=1 Tax=Deinococcus xinjiangensis TaxID=457454 RepID=A0ABP9VAD0_9DEIO
MAKWSGKVFFPTSSQASRTMAQGKYPRLPFEAWKPRPQRVSIPNDRTRLEGVLVMLKYGLRVMPDSRLASFAIMLQDELNRNDRRWVPLDVTAVLAGKQQVDAERRRREALINDGDCLAAWFRPAKSTRSWTQADAKTLREEWAALLSEEKEDS